MLRFISVTREEKFSHILVKKPPSELFDDNDNLVRFILHSCSVRNSFILQQKSSKMAERFREDIINEDFIVRVLKHHRAGKEVELLEFSANTGTSKGDNYMGDLVKPIYAYSISILVHGSF